MSQIGTITAPAHLEESFRASQHSSLQEKIFSNPDQCSRLLTIFHEKMQIKNSLNCAWQKSDLGATGFTFLSTLSSYDVPLVDMEDQYLEFSAHPIEFVLKWGQEQLGRNERMCADILSSYGFSTPKIVEIKKEISIPLAILASELYYPMLSKVEKYALIAMPKFDSSNFKHARDNGKIYQLSAIDQKRMFQDIAEIVPFDFLIGNDDRLIQFTKNPDNFYPQSATFNKGNLLLRFVNGQYDKVHFIDNCTTLDLSEKKKTSDGGDFGFGLFNDIISEGVEASSSSQDSKKSINYQAKIEQLHKIFKHVIQHQEELAREVSKNFLAVLDVKQLKISAEELHSAVQKGIEKGIQKLKTQAPPQLERTEDPFNLRAQELIRLNLQSIK